MSKYTKKEMDHLLKIRDDIQKQCKVKNCDKFNSMFNCECFKIYKWVKDLYYSKIPKDYWMLDLDNLKIKNLYKQFVKKYINNLDNAIENGMGMMFSGEKRGIGKTSCISIIGKEAIKKGYDVYYVIAQNIIDDTFTDDKNIIERIKNCDLLLIDELDKIIMKKESNVPKILENLLRVLLPNKKAILIATNFLEDEVQEKFEIISLIRRYIKIITMQGKDFSTELSEKWSERLEGNTIDYKNKVLIRDSKILFKNKEG